MRFTVEEANKIFAEQFKGKLGRTEITGTWTKETKRLIALIEAAAEPEKYAEINPSIDWQDIANIIGAATLEDKKICQEIIVKQLLPNNIIEDRSHYNELIKCLVKIELANIKDDFHTFLRGNTILVPLILAKLDRFGQDFINKNFVSFFDAIFTAYESDIALAIQEETKEANKNSASNKNNVAKKKSSTFTLFDLPLELIIKPKANTAAIPLETRNKILKEYQPTTKAIDSYSKILESFLANFAKLQVDDFLRQDFSTIYQETVNYLNSKESEKIAKDTNIADEILGFFILRILHHLLEQYIKQKCSSEDDEFKDHAKNYLIKILNQPLQKLARIEATSQKKRNTQQTTFTIWDSYTQAALQKIELSKQAIVSNFQKIIAAPDVFIPISLTDKTLIGQMDSRADANVIRRVNKIINKLNEASAVVTINLKIEENKVIFTLDQALYEALIKNQLETIKNILAAAKLLANLSLEERTFTPHLDYKHLDNNEEKTLSYLAAEQNYSESLALLLTVGAEINSINGKQKQTPIMIAAAKGSVDAINVLLNDDKVDLQLISTQGDNVFHIAVQHGQANILSRLLEYALKQQPKLNYDLKKAFKIAIQKVYIDCVKVLLAHGVLVGLSVDDCISLFEIAIEKTDAYSYSNKADQSRELLQLLMEHNLHLLALRPQENKASFNPFALVVDNKNYHATLRILLLTYLDEETPDFSKSSQYETYIKIIAAFNYLKSALQYYDENKHQTAKENLVEACIYDYELVQLCLRQLVNDSARSKYMAAFEQVVKQHEAEYLVEKEGISADSVVNDTRATSLPTIIEFGESQKKQLKANELLLVEVNILIKFSNITDDNNKWLKAELLAFQNNYKDDFAAALKTIEFTIDTLQETLTRDNAKLDNWELFKLRGYILIMQKIWRSEDEMLNKLNIILQNKIELLNKSINEIKNISLLYLITILSPQAGLMVLIDLKKSKNFEAVSIAQEIFNKVIRWSCFDEANKDKYIELYDKLSQALKDKSIADKSVNWFCDYLKAWDQVLQAKAPADIKVIIEQFITAEDASVDNDSYRKHCHYLVMLINCARTNYQVSSSAASGLENLNILISPIVDDLLKCSDTNIIYTYYAFVLKPYFTLEYIEKNIRYKDRLVGIKLTLESEYFGVDEQLKLSNKIAQIEKILPKTVMTSYQLKPAYQ